MTSGVTLLSESGDVVGRRISIDGRPHTIVGVTRAEFASRSAGALSTPYAVARVSDDPALRLRTSGLSAVARLAPGIRPAAQVGAEGMAMARSVPVTESTRALFWQGWAADRADDAARPPT